MPSAARILIVLLLAPIPNAGGQAGASVSIAATLPCAQCTVTLGHVVTLGKATDSVLPSAIVGPVRDSHGRYFVPSRDGLRVLMYDSTGHLTTVIGSAGPGPIIFSRISRLVAGPGDSLFVKHSSRLSVLAPSHSLVREHRLPDGPFFGMLPLPNGRLLWGAALDGPRSWSTLFHLVDAHGDIVGSIGEPPKSDSGCYPCLSRSAVLDGDQFWGVRPYRYVLEAWRETGERVASYAVVGSRWFDTTDTGARLQPTDRPTSSLYGVDVLGPGLIAVYGSRAAESWRPLTVVPQPVIVGGNRLLVMRAEDVYANPTAFRERDTFVDVIDLSQRAIVSSGRFRELGVVPIGGGLAYSHRADTDGVVSYDIWRLDVRR